MDQQQRQSQPKWTPPPQQPTGWGGPGYGGPPPRPGGVTFAGIFLIVMGVIFVLFALLLFAGGALLGSAFGNQGGGVFAPLGAIAGVVVLVWAILHLAGGIGSLQGKVWGRWTGIVVAIITLIVSVIGLLGSFSGRIEPVGLVIQIVFIALYALTVWALIQASSWFAARR
jgi:hypothetical protein